MKMLGGRGSLAIVCTRRPAKHELSLGDTLWTRLILAQTTACSTLRESPKLVIALMKLLIHFGSVSSDIVDNFSHRLPPLPTIWSLPGHEFVGLHGYITRSQLFV